MTDKPNPEYIPLKGKIKYMTLDEIIAMYKLTDEEVLVIKQSLNNNNDK